MQEKYAKLSAEMKSSKRSTDSPLSHSSKQNTTGASNALSAHAPERAASAASSDSQAGSGTNNNNSKQDRGTKTDISTRFEELVQNTLSSGNEIETAEYDPMNPY